MTAKRFKLSYPNGAFVIDGDKPLCSIENDLMIVDKLNELVEENEQLKSKFYNIIDERIRVLEHDYNQAVKNGMPSNSVYSEIELLEELKEEMDHI